MYFAINNMHCQPNKILSVSEKNYLFASSPCSVVEDFDDAVVKVNKSDYNNANGSVSFWLRDLRLNLAIVDYFGHHRILNSTPATLIIIKACYHVTVQGAEALVQAVKIIITDTNEFNYSIVKVDYDTI